MAFHETDADVLRACTIGNRVVASRGSSRLSPRRKRKEPLSRSILHILTFVKFWLVQNVAEIPAISFHYFSILGT